MTHIHNEIFSTSRKNEIKVFLGKWMELGIAILREIMKTYTTFFPPAESRLAFMCASCDDVYVFTCVFVLKIGR